MSDELENAAAMEALKSYKIKSNEYYVLNLSSIIRFDATELISSITREQMLTIVVSQIIQALASGRMNSFDATVTRQCPNCQVAESACTHNPPEFVDTSPASVKAATDFAMAIVQANSEKEKGALQ
jgi:hypothetical protein